MDWKRSSRCDGGTCVEVAVYDGSGTEYNNMVAVRNSRIPGEIAWFTPIEWAEFLNGVKAGDFDL